MTDISEKGGYLRMCGAMEATAPIGIDVAHALAMSADTPAESYYIRVVYADQECYLRDLVREMLIGDVALWAWDYRGCPGRDKGFLRKMLVTLIDERTTQRCRDCNGTTKKGQMVGGREGSTYETRQVKVIECPTCSGEGVKRYGDDERAKRLGLDPGIYKRHWKSLCQRIEGRMLEWDDKINRIGRYRLWAN